MQVVLREAPGLGGADIGSVRVAASSWLGRVWALAELGDRDPESRLVGQLVERAGGGRGGAAYLALLALSTIAQEPWGDQVAEGLAEVPRAERWPWPAGTEVPPAPASARGYSDPWGSRCAYLVRYAEPEDHWLLVEYSTDFGVMAEVVTVGGQDGDEPTGVDALAGERVDPAEALAEVAEVLRTTDMYWPRQAHPDYAALRALAHWYAAPHDRGWHEPVEIAGADRLALIQDFLVSQGRDRDDVNSDVGLLVDLFIDFADGYLPGGVLAWSPGAVERFMLDWVHRKTILDPEDLEALPDALAAWVEFTLDRKGLAPQHIAEVVESVRENTEEFRDLAGEEDLAGPAKQLMLRAMAAGVDPHDREAMAEIIGGYNAELNARRLLGQAEEP